MSFRDLDLPSVLDTSSDNLFEDFFIPVLKKSIKYDRGVGYFSSGWLKLASEGMVDFAQNGGQARWVTSPILYKKDWEALKVGDEARTNSLIKITLQRSVEDFEQALRTNTLSALAWMIADNIIDFRIALPRYRLDQGDFHDKFGIFTDDEGNQISFNGSYNDSIQGIRNYESIKIFSSFSEPFKDLVLADAKRFRQLWNNEDPNVKVYTLPESIKESIVRLRKEPRPYINPVGNQLTSNPNSPFKPVWLKLRDYQREAINAWFDNSYRGVFEMATGTGKTITALAAITEMLEKENCCIVIITCPYTHLVNQWAEEAEKFGFRPIKAFDSKEKWIGELIFELDGVKKGFRNLVTIISTNVSLQRGGVFELLDNLLDQTVLIADEAHHWGAPKMLEQLRENIPFRLALSATPVRYYDADGTEIILDYFGNVVYQFGLEEAIGKYLTPYTYFPIPVELTDEEFVEYMELTHRVSRLLSGENGELSEPAKRLLIRRARISNNSRNKLNWLSDNISSHAKITHTLFYVGDKLFSPTLKLLGVDKKIRVHEFTQRQNSEQRQKLLTRFIDEDLQALVAMKCLDEGIDVPPTKTAYFIASSGNPREFVQRRGRVLRLYPKKREAIIYDLVSVPPVDFLSVSKEDSSFSAVRSILSREFRRLKDFSKLAINHYQSLDSFYDLADHFDLLDKI